MSKINEVFVPSNYAPLAPKKHPGYFVNLANRAVASIKSGSLRELTPYEGRYKVSDDGVATWVPRNVIAKAKRTTKTKMFYRVPKAA